MATAQEIFDQTLNHLRSMPRQAKEKGDSRFCKYLTADGLQCAIGFRIPEGHPGLNCDGALSDLLEDHPDLREILFPTDMDESGGMLLLSELQHIHDANASWTSEGFSNLGEADAVSLAHYHQLEYHPREENDH